MEEEPAVLRTLEEDGKYIFYVDVCAHIYQKE